MFTRGYVTFFGAFLIGFLLRNPQISTGSLFFDAEDIQQGVPADFRKVLGVVELVEMGGSWSWGFSVSWGF